MNYHFTFAVKCSIYYVTIIFNGNLFTSNDGMLFSYVKISQFT